MINFSPLMNRKRLKSLRLDPFYKLHQIITKSSRFLWGFVLVASSLEKSNEFLEDYYKIVICRYNF
jgi:hypothetical protein